tara:strand:- start:53 stop:238 length:186 start_codon:yes stop_codon:yes gene_type:complete
MFTQTQIASQVAQTLPRKSDRYDQIWAIKEILFATAPILACDRETIDDILDILFEKYHFVA